MVSGDDRNIEASASSSILSLSPTFRARELQDGIGKCRPYLVCCLGELNDVELGAESVNGLILHDHPWLKARATLRLVAPDCSSKREASFFLELFGSGRSRRWTSKYSIRSSGEKKNVSEVHPSPMDPSPADKQSPTRVSLAPPFAPETPKNKIGSEKLQNILQPEPLPSSSSSNSGQTLPVGVGHLKPATGVLTVTDLEVLSAFLLPVLQENTQGEVGAGTANTHGTCFRGDFILPVLALSAGCQGRPRRSRGLRQQTTGLSEKDG